MSTLEEIKSQQDQTVVKYLEKRNFYQLALREKRFIIRNPNVYVKYNHQKFKTPEPEQMDHQTLLTKAIDEHYVGGFWFMFAKNLEDGLIYWHSWVYHFRFKSVNITYTRLEFKPIEDGKVMILAANKDFSKLDNVKKILSQCIDANTSIVVETSGIEHNTLYYKPEFYADSDIMSDEASPIKSYIYSTTAYAMSGIVAEEGVEEVLGTFPE